MGASAGLSILGSAHAQQTLTPLPSAGMGTLSMHPLHMLPPLQTQGLKMSPTALCTLKAQFTGCTETLRLSSIPCVSEVLASKHEDTKHINPDVRYTGSVG